LTGVTWNSTYNGYYDVSGNLYVFDELLALYEDEITSLNNKLWNAINNSNNIKLGEMGIVLTNYTGTGVPQIAAGSWIEINGQMYRISANLSITGATVNNTWYDILLTPSGGTFTASYVARNTGAWSDSKQGLYSGNNRVVACVRRSTSSSVWINKNILIVDNRTVKIKINIGDWNMDSDHFVNVVHGLTFSSIVSVFAVIRSDADTQKFNLEGTNIAFATGTIVSGPMGGIKVGTVNIELTRVVTGFFDSVGFDATSYNRGELPIEYEV
jgi:hypothetical protein